MKSAEPNRNYRFFRCDLNRKNLQNRTGIIALVSEEEKQLPQPTFLSQNTSFFFLL